MRDSSGVNTGSSTIEHILRRCTVPEGVHLVGFADNLALIATVRNAELLKEALCPKLYAVDRWISLCVRPKRWFCGSDQ